MAATPERPAPRYHAFISYSHAADGRFAPALQRGLHQLGRSWRQRRAMEVFRDETGLAVNPDLWGSILAALDGAEWFVLLASPRAAGSRWVGQEIEHCVATKGVERILIVLTEGTLAWDEQAGDFTEDSDAAHPALRGLLPSEPRIVDLSWARAVTDLSIDNERFRADLARIVSIIREEPLDRVVAHDARERRRTRRVVRGAIAALAALTAMATVAAALAVLNQREAERERAAAEAEAVLAQARAFAAAARAEEDPRAALALAVEAHALHPTPESAGGVLTVLSGIGVDGGLVTIPDVLPGDWTPPEVWSASDTDRVVVQRDGRSQVVELDGDVQWSLPDGDHWLAPSGDATLGADGTVRRLLDDGTVEAAGNVPPSGSRPSFSADGTTAAYLQLLEGRPPVLVVASLDSGQSSTFVTSTYDTDCIGCTAVDVAPDGSRALVRTVGTLGAPSEATGTVAVVEVGEIGDGLREVASLPISGPGTARFSDDGSQVWVRDASQMRVLDPATMESAGPAMAVTRAGPLSFLDDTQALAVADECVPPAVVSVPAMAVVAELPAEIQLVETGCVPTDGRADWLAGGAWILTASGIWPADGERLVTMACEALGGRVDAEAFAEVAGVDHDPQACAPAEAGAS